MMADLASKQRLSTRVLLSSGSSTSAAMHVVFAREPEEGDAHCVAQDDGGRAAVLQTALGGNVKLQPLTPVRLQAARMAEQALQRQLRLFDPASWTSVLQASVMTARGRPFAAVRSLVSPAAAEAARELVDRLSLCWVEVEADQMQALASAASPGGTAARTSRRRPRRSSSTATAGSPAGAAAGNEEPYEQPVTVISRTELTAEEAAELVSCAAGCCVHAAPPDVAASSRHRRAHGQLPSPSAFALTIICSPQCRCH
jgi:hypothetical protein